MVIHNTIVIKIVVLTLGCRKRFSYEIGLNLFFQPINIPGIKNWRFQKTDILA